MVAEKGHPAAGRTHGPSRAHRPSREFECMVQDYAVVREGEKTNNNCFSIVSDSVQVNYWFICYL